MGSPERRHHLSGLCDQVREIPGAMGQQEGRTGARFDLMQGGCSDLGQTVLYRSEKTRAHGHAAVGAETVDTADRQAARNDAGSELPLGPPSRRHGQQGCVMATRRVAPDIQPGRVARDGLKLLFGSRAPELPLAKLSKELELKAFVFMRFCLVFL